MNRWKMGRRQIRPHLQTVCTFCEFAFAATPGETNNRGAITGILAFFGY